MADYFTEENELTRQYFNLDKILAFQLKHDVQIIRGEDYMYLCYIDGKGYGTALTPMWALTYGINTFIQKTTTNELDRTETANRRD